MREIIGEIAKLLLESHVIKDLIRLLEDYFYKSKR